MKSQVVHFFVLFCLSTVVLGNCLVQDVSGCKPVNQTQVLDSALFAEARLKLVALLWLAPQWQYWISVFQDLLITLNIPGKLIHTQRVFLNLEIALFYVSPGMCRMIHVYMNLSLQNLESREG